MKSLEKILVNREGQEEKTEINPKFNMWLARKIKHLTLTKKQQQVKPMFVMATRSLP